MDAFQRELVELLPRLRRFARTLAHAADDADDVVQTAVERALARRGSWQAGTRLDSWMFTIVKNAWIDETRSRSRRARVFDTATDAERIADPAAPSLEAHRVKGAIERALKRLPEDQRTAVWLVLVEGLSYGEAAEIIEAPVGTLTSRLVRGRAALAAELAGVEG